MREIKTWMAEHGLTVEMAGRLLGRQSRRIKYYRSGKVAIPEDVVYLMKYWDIMLKKTQKSAVHEAIKQYKKRFDRVQ